MYIIGRPLTKVDVREAIMLSRKIRGYIAGERDDDLSYKTFRERLYENNYTPSNNEERNTFLLAWYRSSDFRNWHVNFRGFVKPVGDPILQLEDSLDHMNDN
jgi:hypothetical protein